MQSYLVLCSLLGLWCVCEATIGDYEQIRGAYSNGFQPQFSADLMAPPRESQGHSETNYKTRSKQFLEKRPQSPWPLRNCYLSPVQCLLPVEQHHFNKFHKRFIM